MSVFYVAIFVDNREYRADVYSLADAIDFIALIVQASKLDIAKIVIQARKSALKTEFDATCFAYVLRDSSAYDISVTEYFAQ